MKKYTISVFEDTRQALLSQKMVLEKKHGRVFSWDQVIKDLMASNGGK